MLNTKVKPWSWANLTAGGEEDADASPTPKARFGHAMCTYGDYAVVFGGMGEGDVYLNDMWVIDTKDWDGEDGFAWQ